MSVSWLENYSKRIKLTIDSTNIDSDLTDFPVLVTLISGTNAAAVFDELSTVSGTKKIAVTTTISGIETELYTEIERWDWSNEEANLWIKVPTVSSGTNTELFLYYDSDHADNTSYVGDTGSTPAQNVWNSGFKAVYHMAQDPNGDVADAIKDSTSNINHGTPAGTMTSADLVDGKVGKAIDFDGTGDKINFPDISDSFSGEASLEITLKLDANVPASTDQTGFGIFGTAALASHYPYTDGDIYFETFRNDRLLLGDIGIDKSIWHTLSITNVAGANNWKFYQNITEHYNATGETAVSFPTNANIGESMLNHCLDGIVCELRISNVVRSAAWIKATYYSNWNDLVAYGSEQRIPIFLFNGYVKVEGFPVARTVYLYRRSDGELVGSTVSDSITGYFEVGSHYDEYHYVVVLPELTESYNLLSYDKIDPGV